MDQGRTLEAQELSRAMEDSRASISETVSELREAVNHAIDWREHVKTHPGASLGIAAGAGLIVGRWVGTKITGSDTSRPGARDEAAGWSPASHVKSVGAPSGRMLDGSRHRAASRAESLVNRVIDEVADVVEAGALVPLFARLRDFLQSGAPARRGDEAHRTDTSQGRPAAADGWQGVQPGTPAGWAANPTAGTPT
jgi:hypothetical protein